MSSLASVFSVPHLLPHFLSFLFRVSERLIFSYFFSQSAPCLLLLSFSECPIFFPVFSHFFSQSQIVSCSLMSLLTAYIVFSCVCSQRAPSSTTSSLISSTFSLIYFPSLRAPHVLLSGLFFSYCSEKRHKRQEMRCLFFSYHVFSSPIKSFLFK